MGISFFDDFSVLSYQEEVNLENVSLGPNPLPNLCHVVVGLPSVGHQHEDFVAT